MTLDIGSVDGTLVYFVDGFISLLMSAVNNLIGAVFFVPIFMVPGLVVAAIGTFTGRRYMKAQLSVRRELR
jgi:formate/nitrite transporter FocA (FNT family)